MYPNDFLIINVYRNKIKWNLWDESNINEVDNDNIILLNNKFNRENMRPYFKIYYKTLVKNMKITSSKHVKIIVVKNM